MLGTTIVVRKRKRLKFNAKFRNDEDNILNFTYIESLEK